MQTGSPAWLTWTGPAPSTPPEGRNAPWSCGAKRDGVNVDPLFSKRLLKLPTESYETCGFQSRCFRLSVESADIVSGDMLHIYSCQKPQLTYSSHHETLVCTGVVSSLQAHSTPLSSSMKLENSCIIRNGNMQGDGLKATSQAHGSFSGSLTHRSRGVKYAQELLLRLNNLLSGKCIGDGLPYTRYCCPSKPPSAYSELFISVAATQKRCGQQTSEGQSLVFRV